MMWFKRFLLVILVLVSLFAPLSERQNAQKQPLTIETQNSLMSSIPQHSGT